MKSFFATTILLAAMLVSVVTDVEPADAALASIPTTSWGVSGLQTGTQTDNIDSPIFATERIGNVLYVGGRFTSVTDGATTTPQPGLAAFDATTGVWISTFLPALNGAVYAIEASPDGTRLFVGGDFTTVDGVSTGALVALNPTTGALDASWTGRVGGYQLVRDFDIEGTQLYVAGGFTSISSAAGGKAAYRVARFDLATGSHDPDWRPVLAGGTVWGVDASPGVGRVYMAGTIKTANGESVSGGLVSIDMATPTNTANVLPLQVNATSTFNQYAYDVLAVNGKVFVAGSQYYVQVLDEADLSLETFHLSKYRGDYQDLELVGDRVYAGCHCRQDTILASATGVIWAGTPPAGETNAVPFSESPNSWVSAFDANTGLHIPSFRPNVASTGGGVWATQDDGNGCLWFAGAITGTGGTAQYAMTRLCDTSTFDFERPSTPGAPSVVAVGVDTIDLQWNPSTDNFGVEGYRVYDNATGTVILDSLEPNGIVAAVAPGTYELYVKAYDAAGNLSWRSGFTNVTVTGIPLDTERPSTPGQPSVVSNAGGTLELAWLASTDNVGVAGYNLFDAVTNTVVATSATPGATLIGLADGTYSYYTKAFDAAGNTSWRSGTLTVSLAAGPPPDAERPSTPGQPAVVSNAGGTLELAWLASTDNVGVAGYNLFDAATNAVVATSATPDVTLTDLADGTYSYYTKAFDAAGNTSWRSGTLTVSVVAGPPPDTEQPSTPGQPSVVAIGADSVDLTWAASTDNVAVAGYQIFDADTGLVVLDVAATTGTVVGLAPASYGFYAKAYDAAGNLSWRSGTVSITIP